MSIWFLLNKILYLQSNHNKTLHITLYNALTYHTLRTFEYIQIKIPPGTSISHHETGQLLADLLEHGDTFTVAQGGAKGLGNVHFKSPTMVRPKDSSKGDIGEELFVELELKSIADIGLVSRKRHNGVHQTYSIGIQELKVTLIIVHGIVVQHLLVYGLFVIISI